MASLIGTILAVSIFSSSYLMTNAYNNQFYEEFDFNSTPFLTVNKFGIETRGEYNNWTDKIKTGVSDIIINNGYELDKVESNMIFNTAIFGTSYNNENEENKIETVKLITAEYSEEIYEILSSSSYFSEEYNLNDRVLLTYDNVKVDIIKNSNDTYSVPMIYNDTIIAGTTGFDYQNFSYIYLNFDHIVTISDDNYYDDFGDTILSNVIQWNGFTLFQSKDKTEKLIDYYIEKSNGTYIDKFRKIITSKTNYYVNLQGYNIDLKLVLKIDRLKKEVKLWSRVNLGTTPFSNEYSYYERDNFSVDSPLGWLIEININFILQLQSINLVNTIILSILTLFLVFFSLSMVIKRKERIISVMKIRGTEINQIKAMLLFEFLVSTLIAIIVGMIISIPWTKMALTTNGFFSFDLSNNLSIFPVSIEWFIKIPILGLIIALDVNYHVINSLSLTSIDDGEVGEETILPLWQRKYIDVVLFFISVLYWIVIPMIKIEKNDQVYTFLNSGLGLIMLIIIIISAPLVTSRFFSNGILIVSKRLWKKENNITSLSIKTMQKYRFTISKLVALLMIGSMLSIIAIMTPPSFEAHSLEQKYYDAGSDMTIMGLDMNNATVIDLLKDPRIESFSEIYLTQIKKQDREIWRDVQNFRILGIDPESFSETAFWRDDYSKSSLQNIVDSINDGENNSIAVQETFLKSQGSMIGSDIYYKFSEITSDFRFSVKESFELFPNMVNNLPYYDTWDNSYYFYKTELLMTIDNLKNFSNNTIPGASLFSEGGVYIKLAKGTDSIELQKEISEKIKFTRIINPLESKTTDIFNSSFLSSIFTMLESIIIIFIIVSMTAFSYYSYISINERKKEIGVFRAMGMIHKQIFNLFLSESLIILISGVGIGSITGILLTNIVFRIYTSSKGNVGKTVPPFRIVFPWLEMVIFLFILFILNLITIIIPPRYLSKKQVGSILRMD